MNVDLSKVLDFLDSLYGMPKVGLVFCFCVALSASLHAVIKRLPWIPNYAIPIVIPCVVPFVGAAFLLGCSQWEKSKIPTVAQFITINFMIGFIAGVLAALIYGVVILKILRRLKVPNGDSVPPFNVPGVTPDGPAKPVALPDAPKS